MRVLVAYASKYGATREIAERIAETLGRHGLVTAVQEVSKADEPAEFDSVVIGSASYFFHWMRASSSFVRRHRETLMAMPVWLYSSGPLGTKQRDDRGRDLRLVTEPKEIEEFRLAIHPRGHRVFFGALTPQKLGMVHRAVYKMMENRDRSLVPEGDFRNWGEIEEWAGSIAQTLKEGQWAG